MRRRPGALTTILVAAAVAAGGCRDRRPPAVRDAASGLRASLSALLVEEVYLTASATSAVLDPVDDGEPAASDALDHNARALARTIGSVYPAAAEPLTEAWTGRGLAFAGYAAALVASDEDKAEDAFRALLRRADHAAAVLAAANPRLDAHTVSALMLGGILAQRTILDARRSGDGTRAVTAVGDALGKATELATLLASAIARDRPQAFPGDVDGPRADLHAAFARTFGVRVQLVGIVGRANRAGSTPTLKAATDGLDSNSRSLALTWAGVYPRDRTRMSDLGSREWRLLVDYGTGDAGKRTSSATALRTFATDVTTLLTRANPYLDRRTVQDTARAYVRDLMTVLDSYREGSYRTGYASLHDASRRAQSLGDLIVSSIARQFPGTFGGTAAQRAG